VLAVDARPDPTADADVAGMLDSQMQAARRYAGAQVDNVMQHLEATRGGFACGIQQNVGLTIRRATAQESQSSPGDGDASSARLQPSLNRRSDADCGRLRRLGVWTSGSLESNERGLHFSSSGLTLGVEAPVASHLLLGVAFGNGFGNASLAQGGARMNSGALALVGYGAYRVRERFFLEWMGGFGSLDADGRRQAGGGQPAAVSHRAGHLLFASVSLGSQLRMGPISASPFLRNDVTGVSLDSYREAARASSSLGYGAATQTVVTLVTGARIGLATPLAGGHVAPLVRADYRHDFASDVAQDVYYLDRPETPYALDREGHAQDALALAVGFEFRAGALGASVEYGTSSRSIERLGGQALRLSCNVGF
jgi:uncharacterized protein with beta-barrel porin domain